jgi:plasmid maintenance system antidote protein VapI
MVTLAEKINRLLADRGLMKRDLARALGVSPQTATDICKGRSSVTLPHLRRLIQFFGLRADFWLDDDRMSPTDADELIPNLSEKIHALSSTGVLQAEDPAELIRRLVSFASRHKDEYARTYGAPSPEERRLLGVPAGAEPQNVNRSESG